jgi:hypothetical protein
MITHIVDDYSNLITVEHSDKAKFVSTVELSCKPFVDLQAVISEFNLKYDVDTAVGQQLDVVGEWVGISRLLPIPLTGVYFTLDSGPGLDSGVLRGESDSLTELSSLPDDIYRVLIYSKILNNHWDGSKTQAYEISNRLFALNGYSLFIVDNCNMTMNVGVVGATTPPVIVQAMLLNHLFDIKPASVKIENYIWQTTSGKMFQFDAQPGNINFGGLDSGHFATITQN